MTLRSLDDVLHVVTDAAFGRPRTIVGLVGAPGAGKSTIGADLVARLNSVAVGADVATLLPMDGYHLPQARLRELGRRDRMGAPDTFDVDGFVATLTAVRAAAGAVWAPGFDREAEEPVPDRIRIGREQRIVVVEGNYLLLDAGGYGRVAPLLDLSLFVEVDPGIRLDRLVRRHERFGKSQAAARAWATGPDEANARLIEATAGRATHRIRLG